MITLEPEVLERILDGARQDVVKALLAEHGDSIRLLSPAQVCGLLDVSPSTLDRMGLPRVAITPKVIKYKISDIARYIESVREV